MRAWSASRRGPAGSVICAEERFTRERMRVAVCVVEASPHTTSAKSPPSLKRFLKKCDELFSGALLRDATESAQCSLPRRFTNPWHRPGPKRPLLSLLCPQVLHGILRVLSPLPYEASRNVLSHIFLFLSKPVSHLRFSTSCEIRCRQAQCSHEYSEFYRDR